MVLNIKKESPVMIPHFEYCVQYVYWEEWFKICSVLQRGLVLLSPYSLVLIFLYLMISRLNFNAPYSLSVTPRVQTYIRKMYHTPATPATASIQLTKMSQSSSLKAWDFMFYAHFFVTCVK